jgi:hydrogenase maturation factor
MVHAGFAIQKMSETGAASAWQLYDEILASGEGAGPDA